MQKQFVLAAATLIACCVLQAFGKLPDGAFTTVVLGVVGGFMATEAYRTKTGAAE